MYHYSNSRNLQYGRLSLFVGICHDKATRNHIEKFASRNVWEILLSPTPCSFSRPTGCFPRHTFTVCVLYRLVVNTQVKVWGP